MGKGGEQPSHNCTANGTITISYTVDKAGNVISARRSSGISDPCVVTAAVIWVKKYVKPKKPPPILLEHIKLLFRIFWAPNSSFRSQSFMRMKLP